MKQNVTVRHAQSDDVAAIVQTLRGSITQLCDADHEGDESRLTQWLSNKTPENVRAWLASPDVTILVGCLGPDVAGVAAFTAKGHITLNYVSPDFRFSGVSSALLARIESDFAAQGLGECYLTSTRTAHEFYRSRGYVDVVGDESGGIEMKKTLSRHPTETGP